MTTKRQLTVEMLQGGTEESTNRDDVPQLDKFLVDWFAIFILETGRFENPPKLDFLRTCSCILSSQFALRHTNTHTHTCANIASVGG